MDKIIPLPNFTEPATDKPLDTLQIVNNDNFIKAL